MLRELRRAPPAGPPDDAVSRRARRPCRTGSAGRPVVDAAACAAGLPGVRRRLPDRRHRAATDAALRARPGPLPLLRRLRGGLPGGRDPLHAATTAWPPGRARTWSCGTPQPAPQAPRRHGAGASFGRSLKLRQVSAGGCNACEADVERARARSSSTSAGSASSSSPRRGTPTACSSPGPVTENMQLALEKTYEAVPPPQDRDRRRAPARSPAGRTSTTPRCTNGAAGVVPGRPLHPRLPAASR